MKAILSYPPESIDDARRTQFEVLPHRIMERVKDQEVLVEGNYRKINAELEYLIYHEKPSTHWRDKRPTVTKIYIKGKYLKKI